MSLKVKSLAQRLADRQEYLKGIKRLDIDIS